MVILTVLSLEVAAYLPRDMGGTDLESSGVSALRGNVGGSIGHGRGVDKGDEVSFVSLHV